MSEVYLQQNMTIGEMKDVVVTIEYVHISVHQFNFLRCRHLLYRSNLQQMFLIYKMLWFQENHYYGFGVFQKNKCSPYS